jgi:hypothetical protein
MKYVHCNYQSLVLITFALRSYHYYFTFKPCVFFLFFILFFRGTSDFSEFFSLYDFASCYHEHVAYVFRLTFLQKYSELVVGDNNTIFP